MSKYQSSIRFIVSGFVIITISALSVTAESSWGKNIFDSIQGFLGITSASSTSPGLAETKTDGKPDAEDATAAANGKIAFSSNRIFNTQKIFTFNSNGTGLTCLMCAGASDPSGTGSTDPSIGTSPAISPNGNKIAFVRSGQIWIMNADGTSPATTGFNGLNPQWSPFGDKLVFYRNINATGAPNNEIFIMNADGTAQTNITNDAGNDVFASWGAPVLNHPQGRIAFRSSRSGNSEIYVIAPTAASPTFEGSPQVNVTNNPAFDSHARWSFDGTKLAFTSDRDNANSEVYTLNLAINAVARLTSDSFVDSAPFWSPDGTKIVFTRFDGNNELFVVDAVPNTPLIPAVNYTNNPASDLDASWGTVPSPPVTNGRIAFEAFSSGPGVSQIYTVADAVGATPVLCGAGETREGRRPAYSHDGTKLAFMRGGIIWTANADCSSQLNTGATGDAPTWSPDGTKIAFVRGGTFTDIWTMNADGSSQTKLTDITTETKPTGSFSNGQPSWGPNNKIVFRGLFRKIVGGSQQSVGDIWTMEAGGTAFTRLTDDPVNAYGPDWSPDAAKIVFVSNRVTNRGEIYTMDGTGTNQTRITNDAAISNSNPAWSPDGLKFVHDDDFSRITTRNINGSNGSMLTNGTFPDWAPATASPSPTPTPTPSPATVDNELTSLTDDADPVSVGDSFHYRVTVTNKGTGTATNVILNIEMFLDDSVMVAPAQTDCSPLGNRFVTCQITGSLGPGTSISRQFLFIGKSPGETQIKATVSANETDTNPANDFKIENTVVRAAADLSVSLTSSTETPSVDREFTYTVKVKNNGPSPATSTLLKITLPANTQLLSEVTGCTRARSSRNLTCALGTLASTEERTLQVRLRPTAPGVNNMRADVSSAVFDSLTANNSALNQLTAGDVPRPPNDNFSAAQALQGEHITVNGTNINATVELAGIPYDPNVGERFHADKAANKSVWYLWISPARRGTVRITTAGSNFDTLLEVRQFIPTQSTMPVVAKNDDSGGITSTVTFTYVPETAYYIAVDGYNGASGLITLKLDVTLFQDPGEYRILQRVTGFSPVYACTGNAATNDPMCSQDRDSNGFLTLTVRGVNFTNTSRVLIDLKELVGFDRNGNPATGSTTFISSTELRAHIPPSPPLDLTKEDRVKVGTPVTLNTGIANKLGSQSILTEFVALASDYARLSVLELQNNVIPPGQTRTVCGNTQFNKADELTCIDMSNIDSADNIVVTPTFFAATAICATLNLNDAARFTCSSDLANGKIMGNKFAFNPRTAKLPSRFTIRKRVPLPFVVGIAPPPPTVKMIYEGGRVVPLIGNDGGSMVAAGGGHLVGNDGASMVAAGGLNLIGNDGASLIGNDGGTLVAAGSLNLAENSGEWIARASQQSYGTSTMPSLAGLNASLLSASDVSNASSGFFMARGSGGSEPTFTITTDEVTGESYGTFEITLDETSSPRASNVAGLAFAIALDPAALQFQSNAITVNEGAGSVTVNVVRSGDTSGAASFDFSTNDNAGLAACNPASGGQTGKASERCDFTTSLGTISFAAGETTKSLNIPIVDDSYSEGSETFNLIIGNAFGAAIQLPRAATITITDNDTANGITNPLDNADAQFFVRQQYLDLLGREPTAGELSSAAAVITQCGSDQACVKTKRIDLSHSLFLQYQQAAAYVFRLYRATHGNNQPFPNPDTSNLTEAKKWPAYSAFFRDRALIVDGANLAQSQLALANAFVLRPEFVAKYSTLTLTDGPSFVDAVLTTIRNDSGVDLASQRDALISLFNQAGRGAVMYRLAEEAQTNPISNGTFIDAEYNRAFAATLYFGYLKRDGDLAGLNSWKSQLDASPLRDAIAQKGLIDAFVNSSAYRARFGPTGVTVSGRVLTSDGRGLRNATVSITDSNGAFRTTTASSFGFYSFDNVLTGGTYTVRVASRLYRYASRTIQVTDNLTLTDFVGLE